MELSTLGSNIRALCSFSVDREGATSPVLDRRSASPRDFLRVSIGSEEAINGPLTVDLETRGDDDAGFRIVDSITVKGGSKEFVSKLYPTPVVEDKKRIGGVGPDPAARYWRLRVIKPSSTVDKVSLTFELGSYRKGGFAEEG